MYNYFIVELLNSRSSMYCVYSTRLFIFSIIQNMGTMHYKTVPFFVVIVKYKWFSHPSLVSKIIRHWFKNLTNCLYRYIVSWLFFCVPIVFFLLGCGLQWCPEPHGEDCHRHLCHLTWRRWWTAWTRRCGNRYRRSHCDEGPQGCFHRLLSTVWTDLRAEPGLPFWP